MNKFPVILDVDTGIDDAVAIALACTSKNLDVKLITCVFGNCEESMVAANTLTVLEVMGKSVPVANGEKKSLNNMLGSVRAHGINGLGGYSKPLTTKPIQENAIDAMHRVVSENELTYIIAVGPYTNIAKYIKKYPQDVDKFKLVAVTGDNEVDRANPYLNFNIFIDIDSFKYVLSKVQGIIFCTSNMGHKAYIPSYDIVKTARCSRVGRFLAMLYPSHKDRTVKDGVALHDACGVAWLVKPNMFKMRYAKAEFKVAENGQEYLDFDFENQTPNCVVTTDISPRKFHHWYYKLIKKMK